MKINGKVWTAVASSAATLAIVACTAASTASGSSGTAVQRGGCDQNCDLQNMPAQYPDWYQLIMNVSGEPTVGIMCVGGGGIMTTSRDNSAAAAQVFPTINDFCKTQIGSRYSVTGNVNDEPRYAKVP